MRWLFALAVLVAGCGAPPAPPTKTTVVLPDVPKGMTAIRREGNLVYVLDRDGTCYRVNLSGYRDPAEQVVDRKWCERYMS
jgi:hypothetical protein